MTALIHRWGFHKTVNQKKDRVYSAVSIKKANLGAGVGVGPGLRNSGSGNMHTKYFLEERQQILGD